MCILRAAATEGFSTPVSAPNFRPYNSNDITPTATNDVLIGQANARLAMFSKLIEDLRTSCFERVAVVMVESAFGDGVVLTRGRGHNGVRSTSLPP